MLSLSERGRGLGPRVGEVSSTRKIRGAVMSASCWRTKDHAAHRGASTKRASFEKKKDGPANSLLESRRRS